MLSEIATVFDPNDVVLIVGVPVPQVGHYVEFDGGLVLELLFVSDDLHSDDFTCLVVETFDGLAEGAFAEEIEDFKSESEMVTKDDCVIALFVIIPIVIVFTWFTLDFSVGVNRPNRVNLFVIKYLGFLVIRHFTRF